MKIPKKSSKNFGLGLSIPLWPPYPGGRVQEQAGFVFGPFRLDMRDERLWRGQVVLVRHKTLGVLYVLVARPGTSSHPKRLSLLVYGRGRR